VVGTCACVNEPSGSIKYGEFLEVLRTGQLLKKDSAAWSKKVKRLCFCLLEPSACLGRRELRSTEKSYMGGGVFSS